MDLEVSISVADSDLSDNFHTAEESDVSTANILPLPNNAQCDSSDSGQFEVEPHLSEGFMEDEDANGNVNKSMVVDENTPALKQKLVSVASNMENECLLEAKAVKRKNITSDDGNTLVIETSTGDSKPTIKLSRHPSFQGPMTTSIRIGTPKRSSSMGMDQDNPNAAELEYTISVSSQNNVTLQMTTVPSVHRPTPDNENSRIHNPDGKFLGDDSSEMTEELSFPEHEIQIGNQMVRLRPRKTPNLSQTEEMKRHSSEISHLRHSLEQKISRNSMHRRSYHDSPYGGRRPLSSVGYSSLRGTPIKEKRTRDNESFVRRSVSQMSSPLHWRKDTKNSANVIDQKKIDFLFNGQQDFSNSLESDLCNEYHNSSGRNNHGTPNHQSYCDHLCSEKNNRRCNTCSSKHISNSCFHDNENNIAFRKNLHNSYGMRSSCSQHSRFNNIGEAVMDKTHMQDYDTPRQAEPIVEEDGRVNYYPNCDATIWLRSCQQEITEPLSGEQTGQIPLWLAGTLIRNGPGRLEVGEQKYNHLFDGSALLHRFYFKKGRVTYQNKFLRSRSYLRDTKAQRIVVNYFGTRAHPDPCRTIIQNIASKFEFEEHFTDNAQISLYPYGDGLYALTETPFIFRVDPETLDTHEKVDLTKYLAVLTHTAHPHVDRDGTVYNIGQGVGPLGPKYHICKFPNPKTDKKGKVKSPFDQAQVVGSVAARWRFNPCYMHSFAMTENYFVIIEQPLVVSVPKILKVILQQDALIDAMQWYEKETKIHVIRRDTGMTIATQYVTETFFFLHIINAYEEKGHIVLDIAAYRNAEMLHCMYVEALKNCSYDPSYARMFRGRPKRWVLPLRPNKDASVGTNLVTLPDTKCQGRWLKKNVVYLTPELLADIGCEVPRINYDKYNGRPYQYFYAICSDVDHPNPGTIVKVDVVNKTHFEWSEDNVYPSEPVFVPHPLAKNEDDGVILSALLRAKGLDNQICMVILDASTFTLKARVEFVAPGPVPKCLHGWFVPEGTLKVHRKEPEKKSTKDV